MSDELARPQETPSSAGRRQGSVAEGEEGEGGPVSAGAEGGGRRDTPSWNGVSVSWILLGV